MTSSAFETAIRNAMQLPDEECIKAAQAAVRELFKDNPDPETAGRNYSCDAFREFSEKFKDRILGGQFNELIGQRP